MSCTVTETLNGEWELTLVYDIDERGKWTRLSEGCILRAPVPAAMTPSVDLVTQQYQTSTYDVQIYKITTKSGPLHLRSGTGTNYRILGKYKKGRDVIVLNKTTSSWYEVTAPDGKHGYMASQYLTFQRTETQTVQTNVGFRNQVIEARQLRDQPFRIYRVVPELDKVTVYARHIFYDLLDNMVKSLKPSPSAVGASVVQSLSGACLSSHDFSFYSDLTSTAEDVEWENINPVEAMLGENGLVSKYGAELARDWYDVFLVRRVGNDTDVSIREKKNLTVSPTTWMKLMWSPASCPPARRRTGTSCICRNCISTAQISALMPTRNGFTCRYRKPRKRPTATKRKPRNSAIRRCAPKPRRSLTQAAIPRPSR